MLSKTRIAFIIAYEKSPYSGTVRPFINWSKEIKRKGYANILILLLKCDNNVISFIEHMKLDYIIVNNYKELSNILKGSDISFVVIDDYIKRLKLINVIRKFSNVAVYSQVLYGSHVVSPAFSYVTFIDKLKTSLLSAIPFSLLRRRYIDKISRSNIVIANSQTTANLLYTLYGIIPHKVIYPPVDTEIFKPYTLSKDEQVIVYLGSNVVDTDLRVLEKVCKILLRLRLKIITFGNSLLATILKKRYPIEHFEQISDEDLAKEYSKSLATIALQKWEQFGYVIAESIACGTPVIAYKIMGPAEIISITKLGVLVNNTEQLINILENIRKITNSIINRININIKKLPFSIENSTKKFIRTIKQYIGS